MKNRSLHNIGLNLSMIGLGTEQFSGDLGITYSEKEVSDIFEEEYKEGMTAKQAISLGVKALKKANEEKFDMKNVEIADVSKDRGFYNLTPEEVKKHTTGKN